GGEPRLVGLIGDDANGIALRNALDGSGVETDAVITSSGLRTTTKVRVIGGQSYSSKKQVIRIDYENDAVIANDVRQQLQANIEAAAKEADAIIFSDYNYGVAEPALMKIGR